MINDICAHMLVKNEDRFIWYSIHSVLPYVSKLLIFDTGSSDKTVEIINLFKSSKIIFEQKKDIDSKKLVDLRNEQIKRTDNSWIWIVDGDEVYPKNTVEKILSVIKGSKDYDGIILHRYDLLGDIYHSQVESVGAYNQFGIKGHYVLRVINKKNIPNLKVMGEYPNEYFADKDGRSIKKRGREKFAFVNNRIFHAMYLKRSSLLVSVKSTANRNKFKIELGQKIPKEEIVDIFFCKRPEIVPDVSKSRGWLYTLLAVLITPVKKIKRIFIQ